MMQNFRVNNMVFLGGNVKFKSSEKVESIVDRRVDDM